MKAGTEGCPEIPQWLASNVPEPGRVGIDPYLHTVSPQPIACLKDVSCGEGMSHTYAKVPYSESNGLRSP